MIEAYEGFRTLPRRHDMLVLPDLDQIFTIRGGATRAVVTLS